MGIRAQSQFYVNPWEQRVGGWEGKEEGDGSPHSQFYNHCRRKESSNINPFHWASYLFNHFPPKCERSNPNSDFHTPETRISSCSVQSETVILVQSLVDKHRISKVLQAWFSRQFAQVKIMCAQTQITTFLFLMLASASQGTVK